VVSVDSFPRTSELAAYVVEQDDFRHQSTLQDAISYHFRTLQAWGGCASRLQPTIEGIRTGESSFAGETVGSCVSGLVLVVPIDLNIWYRPIIEQRPC